MNGNVALITAGARGIDMEILTELLKRVLTNEAPERAISRDIMNLHHSKHHHTYVTNLNATEEKLEQALKKRRR